MIEYLLNHKKQVAVVILALLILIFGVPLGIDWAFKHKAICDFFAVDWNANDALSYYGSVLAFLGTAAFSALALWQNHIFKEANENHEKELEKMEKMKFYPIFECICNGQTNGGKSFTLEIHNISAYKAFNVSVSNFIVNGEKFDLKAVKYKNIDCGAREKGEIEIPDIATTNFDFSFRVNFTDSFGENHFYKFTSFKKDTYMNSLPKLEMKPADKE